MNLTGGPFRRSGSVPEDTGCASVTSRRWMRSTQGECLGTHEPAEQPATWQAGRGKYGPTSCTINRQSGSSSQLLTDTKATPQPLKFHFDGRTNSNRVRKSYIRTFNFKANVQTITGFFLPDIYRIKLGQKALR